MKDAVLLVTMFVSKSQECCARKQQIEWESKFIHWKVSVTDKKLGLELAAL